MATMRFSMCILAAVLLLALPSLSFAAECTGSNPSGTCGDSNIASRSELYQARELYCANNLWRTTPCFVVGKVKITFSHPGANTQQTCWDAFDNIINTCMSNFVRGSYNYNGLYELTRCAENDGKCVNQQTDRPSRVLDF